jgi:hypothetical protein
LEGGVESDYYWIKAGNNSEHWEPARDDGDGYFLVTGNEWPGKPYLVGEKITVRPVLATETDNGNFLLSTGRLFKIEGMGPGALSIDADLEIHEGYDSRYVDDWDDDDTPLSLDERLEVCDAMIARWERLKVKLRADDAQKSAA